MLATKFKCQKREEWSWKITKSEEKEKERFQKKKLIDAPWESNINAVTEELVSSENRRYYTFVPPPPFIDDSSAEFHAD